MNESPVVYLTLRVEAQHVEKLREVIAALPTTIANSTSLIQIPPQTYNNHVALSTAIKLIGDHLP